MRRFILRSFAAFLVAGVVDVCMTIAGMLPALLGFMVTCQAIPEDWNAMRGLLFMIVVPLVGYTPVIVVHDYLTPRLNAWVEA